MTISQELWGQFVWGFQTKYNSNLCNSNPNQITFNCFHFCNIVKLQYHCIQFFWIWRKTKLIKKKEKRDPRFSAFWVVPPPPPKGCKRAQIHTLKEYSDATYSVIACIWSKVPLHPIWGLLKGKTCVRHLCQVTLVVDTLKYLWNVNIQGVPKRTTP